MDNDLYSHGWRQGSVFAATLSTIVCDLDEHGRIVDRVHTFERWVVCTQDCDLRRSESDSHDELIEIRPVLSEGVPDNWGIRSARLRLNLTCYVDAGQPKAHITPRCLSSFAERRESELSNSRTLAFKTWLGLRYDRPAVPDALVDFAKEIAKRCSSKSGRPTAETVHDVLMQFDDSKSPPHAALFAVIADDANPDKVKSWLHEVATRIDVKLGIIAHVAVGKRSQTTLELVETSYAADLSLVTWRVEDPSGAT